LILIGEPDHNSLLRSELERNNIEFNKNTPGEQGYVICSNPNALLLAGNDPAGTFYALRSLYCVMKSNKASTINIPIFLFETIRV